MENPLSNWFPVSNLIHYHLRRCFWGGMDFCLKLWTWNLVINLVANACGFNLWTLAELRSAYWTQLSFLLSTPSLCALLLFELFLSQDTESIVKLLSGCVKQVEERFKWMCWDLSPRFLKPPSLASLKHDLSLLSPILRVTYVYKNRCLLTFRMAVPI